MTAFHRKRIQDEIKPNEDGIHQALVDICYDAWQNEDWSMENMLQNARFSYGKVVEMAVMLGKYNQQVLNGGHDQYFSNGYSGTHDDDDDNYDYKVPITNRMRELMDNFKLSDTDYGKKIDDILRDFIIRTVNWLDSDNYKQGGYPEPDETWDIPDYNDLDDAYYQFQEWWTHELERYFKLWMEFDEDPIATGRF